MEEATTSSGHRGEGERGTGGKFRKLPTRKPSSTPYDRPRSSKAPNQPGAARHRDGWLSKLVHPACRLISGGATRMFPSFFSKHPPSDTSAAPDPQDQGLKQEAMIDVHKSMENLGMSASKGVAGPGEETERSKHASDIDDHEEDEDGSLCNDDRLCEIEQILKGKIFSREEINRLTEILHSKVADLSHVDTREKISSVDVRAQAVGLVVAQESRRKPVEEKQEDLNGAKWRTYTPAPPSIEVGASPIEIARAYMGSRTPDVGIGSKSIISKDDRALPRGDEFALNPFAPLPLPKSSICWPGAVVQDQCGYLTPQSQSGRFGLPNFPRTPYSRTIYSKSRTKLLQSRLDSGRYAGIPSTPLQQLRTPTYGLTKSRGDELNGSVGHIHRMGHKFVSEACRGSVYFPSSQDGTRQVVNISGGLLTSVKNNFELGATSSSSKPVDHSSCIAEVGVSTVRPQTSHLANRILEFVNKNKPTSEEKSAEGDIDLPQLGTSDSYQTFDSFDPKFPAQMNQDRGNSLSKAQHHERAGESSCANVVLGDADMVRGENGGPSLDLKKTFGTQFNGTSEMTIAGLDSSRQNDKSHLWPLHSQSNGLVASMMVTDANTHHVLNQQYKPPPHSSRAKRNFGSISISKPDLRGPASLGSNSGFTFPVAASSDVISEPPTPSFMPSFSTEGLHHPNVEYAVPSYSFGTKRSTQNLVFSFPDTSNATTHDDGSDIKLKFGSDEKARVSFGLVGKNAICS